MPNAEDVRLAVADQPTVAQGAVALFRAIAWAGQRLHLFGEAGPILAIAGSIADDVKPWLDALLANTTLATETAAPAAPALVKVPAHLAEMLGAASSPTINLGPLPSDGAAIGGAKSLGPALPAPVPDTGAIAAAQAEALRQRQSGAINQTATAANQASTVAQGNTLS